MESLNFQGKKNVVTIWTEEPKAESNWKSPSCKDLWHWLVDQGVL